MLHEIAPCLANSYLLDGIVTAESESQSTLLPVYNNHWKNENAATVAEKGSNNLWGGAGVRNINNNNNNNNY